MSKGDWRTGLETAEKEKMMERARKGAARKVREHILEHDGRKHVFEKTEILDLVAWIVGLGKYDRTNEIHNIAREASDEISRRKYVFLEEGQTDLEEFSETEGGQV